MGGPARGLGDRVVDVAFAGRAVAAGPAAGQIPAPHEIGQRLRGHVDVLGGGVTGMHQRREFGRCGQLGDELGGR